MWYTSCDENTHTHTNQCGSARRSSDRSWWSTAWAITIRIRSEMKPWILQSKSTNWELKRYVDGRAKLFIRRQLINNTSWLQKTRLCRWGWSSNRFPQDISRRRSDAPTPCNLYTITHKIECIDHTIALWYSEGWPIFPVRIHSYVCQKIYILGGLKYISCLVGIFFAKFWMIVFENDCALNVETHILHNMIFSPFYLHTAVTVNLSHTHCLIFVGIQLVP